MTVFLRNSVYYYDFILKGRRYAGSTRTANRRKAERFEQEERKKAQGKAIAALNSSPGSITLEDGFKRLYRERWSRNRDAAHTLAKAMRIVAILGADTPLSAIDSPAVSKLSAELREDGLKDSTVNRYLAALKTLLITAQREWQAIPSIPYLKLSKEPLGRLNTFSIEEEEKIQQLLRAEPATPLSLETADLLILLADTGMRLNEGVSLEARDVNLDTGLIHVWESKGDRPRSVPMTDRLRGILKPRLDVGRKRVFTFTSRFQVEGIWKRRIRVDENGALRPEFAGRSIHGLRHTYASRLVQLGVPLYTVQKLLGHSTSAMTQRYAHLAPESFRQSAILLDSLLKFQVSAA